MDELARQGWGIRIRTIDDDDSEDGYQWLLTMWRLDGCDDKTLSTVAVTFQGAVDAAEGLAMTETSE